ncbi:MAG: 4Fe-4S dicluster domain-containing protein [Smithella sp.]|nr:4Fe-4S dicluster domain-containing protein [Smithella sp.]HQG65694.1 4Fe-4S dicluster domain-containing protein [Smithella sp.]
MLKKTAIKKISELAVQLMQKGTLVAPVQEAAGFNFREISDAKQVGLDFHNTILSPKAVFFPQMEDFVRYQTGKSILESVPVELNVKPTFLFGVRPCDVKSFEIMDIHFSGTGVVDPYWRARRESTTIFGYAFDLDVPAQAEEFYQTLGIGAADPDGSDIFMIRKGETLLLKGITPKGEKLLTQLSRLADCTANEEEYFRNYIIRGRDFKTRYTCVDDKNIAKKLEDIFDNGDFWMKVSVACLSCGVCTFVCPNCYCFDICDETLFGKGTRRRVWDACMFTDFTLEASGHNPRSQVFQRLRQKIKHKYSYHVRKYGVISCVGCGRCTRHCPVNIDIFSIVEEAMTV